MLFWMATKIYLPHPPGPALRARADRLFAVGIALSVALGGVSGWSARAVAGQSSAGLPFNPGDTPPQFGPLRMGETIRDIFATLGLPDSGETTEEARSGRALIDYGFEGYYLLVAGDAGLRTIVATLPSSGNIGGMTVGTSVDRVLKTWGKPRLQNNRTWIYPADMFVVEIRIDPKLDHVSAIMLVDLRGSSSQIRSPAHGADQPNAIFRLSDPPPPHRQFPFTRDQDWDSARFVWFVFGKAKQIYDYIPVKDFPEDRQFRVVTAREPALSGDIAWWPNFVGIFDKERRAIMTGTAMMPLTTLEKQRGPAHFFRLQTDSPNRP